MRRISGCEALDPSGAASRVRDPRQELLDAMHLPAATLAATADGGIRVVAVNRAFRRLLLPVLCADKAGPVVQLLAGFVAGTVERHRADWCEPGVAGRRYDLHLSRLPDATALLFMVDRTAQVDAERGLRAEMLRDSLTGLPNRAAFIDRVETAVADGAADHAALAIDLVRFSRINEGVGTLAGDELILTVARRLRAALGPDDVLARTAGDEFGVLVRLAPGTEPLDIARRLHDSLAAPFNLSDLEIRVDGAIGCATTQGGALTAAAILAHVQVAVKRAKQSGRIELYEPGEVKRARRRFSLETELRRAIDRDELTLAFQPLLDLHTSRVTGFEALARWTHLDHGPVSPAEFIPVAEESGLIVPLGRWALARAARTLAEWDARAGRTLATGLNVNVSPVQLARDSLVAAVEGSGIDPARLTLELTESSIVADPERARGVLATLHERRCRVAMDDFGTGYSCLAYLQRLPIDVLKIDRSLVADMHLNRDSMAIVRAVVSLARSLGLSTTAEGVERTETATLLTALGCVTGQGYLFARPLAPDDAYGYLVRA